MHHALFTGLLLRMVLEKGAKAAGALAEATFRAQHDDKFLPALKTLGLGHLPDAVACAQFFYLANKIGGVGVECMRESDKKAWIRYPPPRWAYLGASLCGIPNDVTVGMLRGFHGRCGETLGNARLGFVCTGMTTDGDSGLIGYFQEYDHALAPEERLRFAWGEPAPKFDPDLAPEVDWPQARLLKARRNYALAYISRMLPACREVAGDKDGAGIAARACRLVGLSLYQETACMLGILPGGARNFASYLEAVLSGCGDVVTRADGTGGSLVTQKEWRLMEGAKRPTAADFDAWSQLWRGAALAHDRSLSLDCEPRGSANGPFRWVISHETGIVSS